MAGAWYVQNATMDTGTGLALVPAAASSFLYLAVMTLFAFAMLRHGRRGKQENARSPRVTICKPLAGTDDDLALNLESFARLRYPSFEILLGVASTEDPAYQVARAFVARHPEIDARLFITDPSASVNPKVAQLLGLQRHARGDVLVISDSNVRVSPSYLDSLVHELQRPNVGLVTSVFAGTGERSLGAALENLQLGTMTAPAVVAASVLPVRPLTVGKSMAMWRDKLSEVGGLERVGGVLAEDHVLGQMFLDAGHDVATSLDVVENRNIDCTIHRTLERHTRWAKMRRAIVPGAFFLEPLLSPILVASVAAIAFRSREAALALLFTVVFQTVLAHGGLRLLRGHALAWYWAPLEVLRTYLLFFCWMRACLSRRIQWRGHPFLVMRDSVIVPAPPSSWSRLRAAARV